MLIGKPHNDICLLKTTSEVEVTEQICDCDRRFQMPQLSQNTDTGPQKQAHASAEAEYHTALGKTRPLCAADLTPRNRKSDAPSASSQVRRYAGRSPWTPLMLCLPRGLPTLAQASAATPSQQTSAGRGSCCAFCPNLATRGQQSYTHAAGSGSIPWKRSKLYMDVLPCCQNWRLW